MKALTLQPNLVEQVRDAILDEISSGHLASGERIIQEQLAQALGVSRQPVQQALMLLRNQGVLQDAPGRGLHVAPLDPEHVGHMYDMRAVLEGLADRATSGTSTPPSCRPFESATPSTPRPWHGSTSRWPRASWCRG